MTRKSKLLATAYIDKDKNQAVASRNTSTSKIDLVTNIYKHGTYDRLLLFTYYY